MIKKNPDYFNTVIPNTGEATFIVLGISLGILGISGSPSSFDLFLRLIAI